MNIRIIFFLFFTTNVLADTIYLKNGKVIEGKIINQTRTIVQIKTDENKIFEFNKEQIERIEYGPTNKDLEEQKKQEEERKRKEELKRKQEEEERKRLEEIKRKQEELRKQEEELKRQEELRRQQENITLPKKTSLNQQLDVYLLLGPNFQKPIIARYFRSLLSAFSKFSLIDQKSQEKSINTGKDKLKDSYTINTGVVYRNPFLNLGFDFISIDSTYYFFIFFGYNSNSLNLYVNPTKHQFDPYKQLQYKVFLEIDPFMIFLQPPLRFNTYKFYLHISSLDQYFEANLNQTNLVFISNYGGANNLVNVFSNTKISINEKGILLGPSIQLNLEPYVMSARYALIKGNASLKYKNNHFVDANILFSNLSVSTIERNARLGGFEFALDLKRTIYSHLFFVGSIRSLEVDYRFNSINAKSFYNNQFFYIDNTTPFFSVVDEKKLHYTILDILFGIEYRFDI